MVLNFSLECWEIFPDGVPHSGGGLPDSGSLSGYLKRFQAFLDPFCFNPPPAEDAAAGGQGAQHVRTHSVRNMCNIVQYAI